MRERDESLCLRHHARPTPQGSQESFNPAILGFMRQLAADSGRGDSLSSDDAPSSGADPILFPERRCNHELRSIPLLVPTFGEGNRLVVPAVMLDGLRPGGIFQLRRSLLR